MRKHVVNGQADDESVDEKQRGDQEGRPGWQAPPTHVENGEPQQRAKYGDADDGRE